MNRPNQIVPSFVSVYLSSDTAIVADSPILFDIIETDGSDVGIYNRTTGTFTAPMSAWYDIDVHLLATLTKLYIVKNGDTTFPIIGTVPVPGLTTSNIRGRFKLAYGETIAIYISGSVVANTGIVPNSHVSNAIFTLVKRFDDTKTF